jgi:hypothetical protein
VTLPAAVKRIAMEFVRPPGTGGIAWRSSSAAGRRARAGVLRTGRAFRGRDRFEDGGNPRRQAFAYGVIRNEAAWRIAIDR